MKTRLAVLLALFAAVNLFAASTPVRPPRPPLLAAGTLAPDFTAYGADRKP
jgi:hypothetical protein